MPVDHRHDVYAYRASDEWLDALATDADKLEHPVHEKTHVLIVTGCPAPDVRAPRLRKLALDDVPTVF